jgi:outer membrane protein TolC
MTHRTVPLLGSMFLSASLTACTTVGPDYHAPPPVAIGSGWSEAAVNSAAPADLARWWSTLNDPVLERLVDTALARNLDLRQATARIDEARALRDRVAGGQAPVVSAGTSVNRRRQSENGPLPIGAIPGLEATQTIHDAGFDASWEIDVFGGQRRALESAQAKVQASEADAQGARMRIVAEVARTWFSAVGAAYELRAQQAMSATLQQTLDLVRKRQAAGDASLADVEAAYGQWATANAALPELRARQRPISNHHGSIFGVLPSALKAFSRSAITWPASPMIGTSTRIFLLIEDGSISIWISFEPGVGIE